MIKKIGIATITITILFCTILPNNINNVAFANPIIRVVGSSALKFLGGTAVKGGVKATTKKALTNTTKHSIRKLTKDGKVVSIDKWIKDAKTKPTTISHGGKFVKYTLGTASFLGMIGMLTADEVLPEVNKGKYYFEYDDIYTDEMLDNPNIKIIGTKHYYIDTVVEDGGMYKRVYGTFYWLNPNNNIWMSKGLYTSFNIAQTIMGIDIWSDDENVIVYYEVNGDPLGERFETKTIKIKKSDWYKTEEEYMQKIGDEITVIETLPSTELIIEKPTGPIVPNPDEPEIEIYIPRNPDGLEQIRENPDIIFNPDEYEHLIPEGDPSEVTDAAGEPILDEEGNPLPDPGQNPDPEPLPNPDENPWQPPKNNWGEKLKTAVTTRFPFSLPWDLYKMISLINADPVKPDFKFDGEYLGIPINFELKWLDEVDKYMPFIRGFIVIGFSISLILATRKLLGGGV